MKPKFGRGRTMQRFKAAFKALIIILFTGLIGAVWVATIIADIRGRSEHENEVIKFELRPQ
jgi:hypothetical protein